MLENASPSQVTSIINTILHHHQNDLDPTQVQQLRGLETHVSQNAQQYQQNPQAMQGIIQAIISIAGPLLLSYGVNAIMNRPRSGQSGGVQQQPGLGGLGGLIGGLTGGLTGGQQQPAYGGQQPAYGGQPGYDPNAGGYVPSNGGIGDLIGGVLPGLIGGALPGILGGILGGGGSSGAQTGGSSGGLGGLFGGGGGQQGGATPQFGGIQGVGGQQQSSTRGGEGEIV
ncbi:MAG: hypothetical protein M3Z04_12520 [Chloroflexota bacterium]|nr:hypothetical protein [Chloroflexota bacterium]